MSVRRILRTVCLLLSVSTLMAIAGAAQAKTDISPETPPAAAALPNGVNDFRFSSFRGEYFLGRDTDQRSTLRTVETLVAEFPDIDQNRGIIRAIPTHYDNHPTDITLVSVTDEQGNPRKYRTELDGGFLLVTIAADTFVYGSQSYVLTYTQNNVTRYFADTRSDEFYWDINGTGWKQPFDEVSAQVHVDSDLSEKLTKETACYRGVEGSSSRCTIAPQESPDGSTVFQATTQNLAPGENMTVAIGFLPGTFVARDSAFFSSGWSIAEVIFSILSMLIATLAIVRRATVLRDAPGRPTIIAEYTPPKGSNVLTAAVISGETLQATSAALISLAVRRNIQIVEKKSDPEQEDSATSYWLQLLTTEGLDDAELSVLKVFFGDTLEQGSWHEIVRQNTPVARGMRALMTAVRTRCFTDGYFRGKTVGMAVLLFLGSLLFGALTVLCAAFALDGGYGEAWPVLPVLLSGAAFLAVLFTIFKRPLEARGSELRDYLKGMKLYLQLAEKERFAMLQSPEGALRTSVNAPDWGQVVKIYEKLLPYAVLFRLEKEWTEVLGTYYENLNSQPEWYHGTHAFSAVVFANSVGAMTARAESSSSYSSSGSSSSFGGSSGGGFSGGGGGGGGGGGI